LKAEAYNIRERGEKMLNVSVYTND